MNIHEYLEYLEFCGANDDIVKPKKPAHQTQDYKEYYASKLEQGIEYQDFVRELFYKEGFPIMGYESRKYQIKGENIAGVEIKFDDEMKKTKNLYIETAEKAHPRNVNYAKSGINRDDNSWLYVIGDYSVIFTFPKRYLPWIQKKKQYREVEIPTSKGFLMPVQDAFELSILTIRISQ